MIANRQLKQQTRDLLEGLGSCRNQVADTLRRAGVRGKPKDEGDCAVAVYLKAVLGSDQRIHSLAVQSSNVKVVTDQPRRLHPRTWVTVWLPEPVRQFIVAFDGAAYPDLVRKGSDQARHSIGTIN